MSPTLSSSPYSEAFRGLSSSTSGGTYGELPVVVDKPKCPSGGKAVCFPGSYVAFKEGKYHISTNTKPPPTL